MGGGFGKLGITMKDYIPHLYRLREAVGPDFDLIQEANTRWSVEQCLEICPVPEELKFLCSGYQKAFSEHVRRELVLIEIALHLNGEQYTGIHPDCTAIIDQGCLAPQC